MFVFFILPISAPDRFACIVEGLCKAVAARGLGGVMNVALIWLIWTRLRRINGVVQALAARIAAGTLRVGRVGPRGTMASRVGRTAPQRLPRRFAWLVVLVPYHAAGFGSQLQHLLADPEMAALLAATPRMARALRPLCRMLGVDVALLAPSVPPAEDVSIVAEAGEDESMPALGGHVWPLVALGQIGSGGIGPVPVGAFPA